MSESMMKISENNVDGVNRADDGKSISTQLRLVSSESLDKDAVLRRIRHRKCMNKVQSTFSSLLSLNNTVGSFAQEQNWVDLGDAFTCP